MTTKTLVTREQTQFGNVALYAFENAGDMTEFVSTANSEWGGMTKNVTSIQGVAEALKPLQAVSSKSDEMSLNSFLVKAMNAILYGSNRYTFALRVNE